MAELHLQRTSDTLTVRLEEYSASLPFADIAPSESTGQYIYDDATVYGRELFDKTFHDEQIRSLLTNLPTNERLLLVADDPSAAAIPWEYLRDQNNKLLASRLNFVRGIPESQRKDKFSFNGPLEIIAIPVSPVDEPRVLNVEGEWKNLAEAVTITSPPKSLTLKRVRPPTRSQLERSLRHECISIVHFMGHSTSHTGKAFLAFEDARARSHLVDAADFADSLNTRVFLVVLNSCLSAVVTPTEFGNIAQGLVYRGVPYALGMQFILPDDAALVLSDALYDFLLQGHNVEEAVMHTRRALEEPGKLSNPAWLVGIPVLYTSLRTPASPIELISGHPTIQPDPARLQETCDLTALPHAPHFLGRSAEISEVLDALLSHRPTDFVVLHGLGGIGKTSLARVVAERVSYHYSDRVLAVSFETFAALDTKGQLVVDENFADRFYNQLAHFYDLDPASYNTTADLQRAILQRWMHLRSLLVLDNIETLIDAQVRGYPAAKSLATFISRLKEGDGTILFTSRVVPPIDWGDCKIISVSGLSDDAGGSLLLTLLPPARRAAALPEMHRKLSQRVKGHPLSIRLLAGRFAESTTDLEVFLQEIDAELRLAEQTTPTSLEDPERQATLYACMDYSVKRLTTEQRRVLDAISLFRAPFPSEFAAYLLNDTEQTAIHLQHLMRLGLLTADFKTFKEGNLVLLELHPMLRWYIQHYLREVEASWLQRYGEIYKHLAQRADQPEGGFDQSSLMRYLVRQSLPDFEAAFSHLPPRDRSSLAFYLAKPYHRLGQNKHALMLYERALEIDQELGNIRGMAETQSAIADRLRLQGKPQEALALFEQALRIKQDLGDVQGMVETQQEMANVLREQGKMNEAVALYERALHMYRELGDERRMAVAQQAMADTLVQQGKLSEAMFLYEQALHTDQAIGNMREVAVTEQAMAGVLVQQGKLPEAQELYEQALRTMQELGDVREVAAIQQAMADVLVQQGKVSEAMTIYEQVLHTMQELGDVRSVAIAQNTLAITFEQQGKLPEAQELYEQALRTMQELGDIQEVAATQQAIAGIFVRQGKFAEAQSLYEQALRTMQELENIEGVAVIQANFSQLLLQQREYHRALRMAWEACTSLSQHGYSYLAQNVHQLLISFKGQILGPEEFDRLWEKVMDDPQPDWLRDVRTISSSEQSIILPEQLNTIIANTILVMPDAPESRAEWRETVGKILWQAENTNLSREAELFKSILALLDNQESSLPEDHPYADILVAIRNGIAVNDVQNDQSSAEVSYEVMQAVHDYVSAENWEAARRVVEVRQDILFQIETEVFFEQLLTETRTAQAQGMVDALEMYLFILRSCKNIGIAETFKQLAAAQEEDTEKGDLPFDAELISHSIKALLGTPSEKMAHMQYLTAMANETTDAELQVLINTIQLAMFSKELSQLGSDLKGAYRQAWETIATSVEAGDIDPQLFERIASNTMAVLGSASHQRSEWRNTLVQVRNHATAHGNRNMVALLDAVIGLLDADGNAAGLGESLQGIYAKTWQTIVDGIAS